jgi:hypothetical protein
MSVKAHSEPIPETSPGQEVFSGPADLEGGRPSVAEIRRRNHAAQHLLESWMADTSGYDEATWPELREALEENRGASARRLFS